MASPMQHSNMPMEQGAVGDSPNAHDGGFEAPAANAVVADDSHSQGSEQALAVETVEMPVGEETYDQILAEWADGELPEHGEPGIELVALAEAASISVAPVAQAPTELASQAANEYGAFAPAPSTPAVDESNSESESWPLVAATAIAIGSAAGAYVLKRRAKQLATASGKVASTPASRLEFAIG